MKKKDLGAVHKFLAMLLLWWTVTAICVMAEIMKAGYVSRLLEDLLTQANLSALLIDPYHYGATGELVFENARHNRELFEQVLEQGLGEERIRESLGIAGEAELLDFRLYEVIDDEVVEMCCDGSGNWTHWVYERDRPVLAPDGTRIETASVYAKIAVPVCFRFGIEMTAVREHCADIVGEEMVYE